DAFREAYQLVPSPNLNFNMGVALDQLGRYAEAVSAFEEFLDATPDVITDARVTEACLFAKARLAALEPKVARLELAASPVDAVVIVDELPVTLSRKQGLPVMAGEHTIRVQREAYTPAVQRLSIANGEHRRIDVKLQPIISPIAPV